MDWIQKFKTAIEDHELNPYVTAIGDEGQEPPEVVATCEGTFVLLDQSEDSMYLLCERVDVPGRVVFGIGDDGTYMLDLKDGNDVEDD